LRNGAGELPSVEEGQMARGTNDDVVYLVTGNEDLITARLSSEHDDDGRDPYALFSDNVA
jgi:hypothetical protein